MDTTENMEIHQQASEMFTGGQNFDWVKNFDSCQSSCHLSSFRRLWIDCDVLDQISKFLTPVNPRYPHPHSRPNLRRTVRAKNNLKIMRRVSVPTTFQFIYSKLPLHLLLHCLIYLNPKKMSSFFPEVLIMPISAHTYCKNSHNSLHLRV